MSCTVCVAAYIRGSVGAGGWLLAAACQGATHGVWPELCPVAADVDTAKMLLMIVVYGITGWFGQRHTTC
jgi:hypothetical protein